MPGLAAAKDPKPLCYVTRSIKSVGDDAYVFHCVTKFDKYKINRNMIVLKNNAEGGHLTLINPLLLSAAGEQALLKLGPVKHIVRLGRSFSFYDDRAATEDKYYLSKFPDCQRWAPGKLTFTNLPVHNVLEKGATMPHPDCRCFVIESTEAVLILSRKTGGDLLIAGDCLQHQVDNAFVNVPTLAHLKANGFMKASVVVSKKWLNAMAPPEGPEAIHKSMQLMTKAKFHRFISTSGNIMLKQEAKKGVIEAIQKVFEVTA